MVDEVEAKLIQMPLPRLQVLGSEETRFIYDYDFTVPGPGKLQLLGRAGDHLVQLSGLLRPIVQRRWADTVRRINGELLGESELDEFLFGAERVSLDPVRAPLREIQRGRCFYCDGRINQADVDHFLPWARHPDNGIFNLVAAHPTCNNSKRDFLASAEHLRRWSERFDRSGQTHDLLTDIAEESRWPQHAARTLSTARGLYLPLRLGAKLWAGKQRFEDANPVILSEVLAGLGPEVSQAGYPQDAARAAARRQA